MVKKSSSYSKYIRNKRKEFKNITETVVIYVSTQKKYCKYPHIHLGILERSTLLKCALKHTNNLTNGQRTNCFSSCTSISILHASASNKEICDLRIKE